MALAADTDAVDLFQSQPTRQVIDVPPTLVTPTFSQEEKASVSPKNAVDPPPPAPGPEDCCMGGCAHCVWDIYEDEFNEWKKRRRKAKGEVKAVEDYPDAMMAAIDPSIKALRDMERLFGDRKA
ncbi:hypothetical protein HK101_007481 [Irineochytrium annulatum]|nr:hypothetical protein HK101_007481 [Irineochytrium annulatum]